MFSGFTRLVEERIRKAQEKGEFDNLDGVGKPLDLEDDRHIAEDLRLAHKILKNADCLPPEIEIKKEIENTEQLLAGMDDAADKYSAMKKLNFLIMKLNSLRKGSIEFDAPQRYSARLVERLEARKSSKEKE